MTNNPILDVAIANLHNSNRAIAAEVQVKRLRELNRELAGVIREALYLADERVFPGRFAIKSWEKTLSKAEESNATE